MAVPVVTGDVAHALHAEEEPSGEKLATWQFWHVVSTPSRKNWFTPQHREVVPSTEQRLVDPAAHVSRLVHARQAEDPATAVYVPAEQAWHVCEEVAPVAVEYCPEEHDKQVPAWELPTVMEYFPVPQAVHVLMPEAPDVTEYVPARHAVQTPLDVAPELLE